MEDERIWKIVEYQIKKERLEKDYFQDKITAEEFNYLLDKLRNEIFAKTEFKKIEN